MKKAFLVAFSWIAVGLAQAGPFEHLIDSKNQSVPHASERQILAESQISYRAEGGFTGVESYGVIISCVKGKISVMKSIYDPRLQKDNARMRALGSMDKEEYVQLWKDLERQAFFKMRDSSPLTMDIADEFTNHFVAKVGDRTHKFDVVGISRPEASRYFALRERIDQSVAMKTLWSTYSRLSKRLDEPALSKNIE